MKKTSFVVAACVGVLAVQSAVNAAVAITSGTVDLQITGSTNPLNVLPAGLVQSNVTLQGAGPLIGTEAAADYNITNSEFHITYVALARREDTFSRATGTITFTLDAATDYSLSGFLRAAEGLDAALSSIDIELTRTSPVAENVVDFTSINTTLTVVDMHYGASDNATIDGTLAAGTYTFTYTLLLNDEDADTTNGPATGTGGIHLTFLPVPEPASLGFAGVTAVGLLIRRRK